MSTQPSTENSEPVLTLVQKIKEKTLDPRRLSPEDRRRCVDVLSGEGHAVAHIAHILQCGERTIHRDRLALRALHALQVDAQFAPQMAGELMRQAEASMARLRRIARESEASAMERLMAEASAMKICFEMVGKLQSLGYLPRVPTGVVTQVIAGDQTIASCEQLAQRLADLERVDRELGVEDPQRLEQRRLLREMVHRAQITAKVDEMMHRSPERS